MPLHTALGLYALAALCEIAGCFTFWMWLRQGKSALWALLGAGVLVAFATLLTRIDVAFAGRAYAAYGGVYIAASVVWMWLVEGEMPSPWDLAGGALCLAGMGVILMGALQGQGGV